MCVAVICTFAKKFLPKLSPHPKFPLMKLFYVHIVEDSDQCAPQLFRCLRFVKKSYDSSTWFLDDALLDLRLDSKRVCDFEDVSENSGCIPRGYVVSKGKNLGLPTLFEDKHESSRTKVLVHIRVRTSTVPCTLPSHEGRWVLEKYLGYKTWSALLEVEGGSALNFLIGDKFHSVTVPTQSVEHLPSDRVLPLKTSSFLRRLFKRFNPFAILQ